MEQLVPMIVGLPFIGFWLWMLIDLGNNDYISSNEKKNWFARMILFNIFGAVWYYLVEYKNRNI